MYKFPFAAKMVLSCTALLLVTAVQGYAQAQQDTSNTSKLGFWEDPKLFVPLLQSQNVTALTQLPFKNIGNSRITGSLDNGALHRVQQPEAVRAFQLLTERYQKLNNMSWYGKFSYQQEQDKDMAYNLVMDPYRGTPFIMADSIGGTWNKQLFGLEARAVYNRPDSKLFYGLGMAYKVAMGAKQVDPRPMNYVNSLTLSPSIRWAYSNMQSIGLTGIYGFRKENISIAIRNPTTLHNLYRLKGLGIHDPVIPIGTGASRHYSQTNYGAEVQHQLRFNDRLTLTSIVGLKQEKESATDGSLIPYPAGDYARKLANAHIILQKKGMYWQEWQLRASAWRGNGTEYHTQYDNQKNIYQVIFQGKTYFQDGNTVGLTYSWVQPNAEQDIAQRWSIAVNWERLSESYNIVQPSSQNYDNLYFKIAYQNFKVKTWRFKGDINYQYNLAQSMLYTPNTGTNLMAKALLYPDFEFLTAEKLGINAEVKKLIQLPSTPQLTWYAFANGQFLRSISPSSNRYHGQERRSFAIGIGTYY